MSANGDAACAARTVRTATRADRAGMLALWDEAFPGEHDYAAQFLDEWLGKTFAVVMGSTHPISAMAFGFDVASATGTYRYLYALAVRQAARGHGLGRAFLLDYERRTAAADYAGVLAVVMPDGPWGFYEKLGYAAVLRRQGTVYGVLKRFDGTLPDPLPTIANTME